MRSIAVIRLTSIIPCLLLCFGSVSLHAQTGPTYYYVSPTGNDSNPGTESLPWKTLTKAASMATANTTVFIKQGIYRERLVPVNSGTADGPITFTSYPGDSVTINGLGIKLPSGQASDRWWSGLIHVEGLAYIKISGLRVVNSEASGVLVTNCGHITVEKNYTDNTFSSGIVVNGCNDIVVDANEVVSGCTGLDQECVSIMATTLFEIKNNRVHDGFTEGIDVKVGSSNGMVSNNEIYNQGRSSGIYVEAWDKHEFNIDVFDNISHNNVQGFAVASENGGLIEAIKIHHNTAYKNSDRGIIVAGWGIAQTHPFRNIEIYGNASYDNRVGIEIGGYTGMTADSVRVHNNLIYHNITGIGITRYDTPSGQYVLRNIEIVNNTICGNGALSNGWSDGGINVSNISPENVFIRNNILSNNAAYTICVQPEVPRANITIDYNFFDGFRNFVNETAGTNAMYGNPLFVDTLRNDYHLQAASPCIDKGNPSQEYNDPADPNKPGYALYPAQGTIWNDMGAYGGPYASSLDTTVIAAPLTPTLIGPANGEKSISITPTLSWERAMGAVIYRLQISLNFWFSTNVVDDSTIAETFKSIGPLQAGMTYFWRVNAKNEGGTSAWSQVRSFTTIVTKPLVPAFYVSPTGNDSNPGTEPLPWKTLAKAASTATANTTVFIKQGIYRERLVPVNSGTQVGPITFTSYPGDSVTITGVGMIPPTGWWAGLIWIQGLSYIKISGLRVINSVNTGIDVENCSHITIEKNYVDSTYSPGIKAYASDNVTFEGNEVVHGCTGLEEECLTLSSTNLFEVKNNLVHDGFTEGINAKNCSNGIITRNEVYNQKYRVGFYAGTWDKHQFNIDVFDNISHDNLHGFSVCSENEGLLEAIRIYNNKAYNNIDRGLWVAGLGIGQTHPTKNIAIYGNDIHDNGFGMEIGGLVGTTIDSIKIFNNLIYRNKGVGVRITRYDGPSGAYAMRNVSVINNTIYGNGTVGNGWDADNGGMNIFNVIPVNLLIRNNILSNNTICAIFVSPEVLAGSLTIDYNFFDGFRNYANETMGTNAIYGKPLFVDSLRNDYHLQAASPCVDKGDPSQEYNDPADPKKPGYALYPAQGTLRNDMGAYGGSYATSWNVTTSVNIDFSTLPKTFELYQNYPNPFNPSTTISFLLPSKSFVSLKIFDLLGREAATIVSEEMSVGSYSRQWNAANMSSGIYFYRLQAGSFIETKKLILIK
jgi:parallel beta-helix repeat protein